MAIYSFKNCTAAIVGPGLVANIGDGAAVAEEGITIEAAGDKNQMTIGADGRGQHTMLADDSAKVTIRLLKTSPTNALLMAAYDFQSISSSNWGQNVITVVDTGRGDATTIQACAFSKKPTITYAKEAGMMEWVFDGIKANSILGAAGLFGSP